MKEEKFMNNKERLEEMERKYQEFMKPENLEKYLAEQREEGNELKKQIESVRTTISLLDDPKINGNVLGGDYGAQKTADTRVLLHKMLANLNLQLQGVINNIYLFEYKDENKLV